MLKNIGSSWVRTAVTAVYGIVSTPYIFRALGQPANTWEVINSYTGVLMLLALGIPMATSRIFSTAIAQKDGDRLNAAVASSGVLYLALGAVACVVGAGLFWFFDRAYVDQTVVEYWPEHVGQVRLAFGIIVGFIALNFLAQLPIGVLAAHEDFVVANAISTVGVVAKLGLLLSVLALEPTVVTLAAITLGVLTLELLAGFWAVRRRHPHVRFAFFQARWSEMRAILSFSGWVLLLNLGLKLAFQIDGVVLASFGEADDPYQYRSANQLMVMLIEFIVAIGAVALPRVARLEAQGDMAGVRALYMKWTKVGLSMTLVAGLYLVVFGREFIVAWMNDAAFGPSGGVCLQVLMVSCFFFMPIRGVSVGVLMGLGKARIPGLAFLAMGVLNLGLSLLLVGPYGIVGVALGTAIPNVLFAVAVASIVCREIGLPLREFLTHVAGRAVPAAVVSAGLLWAAKTWIAPTSAIPLFVTGVAHVVVFAAIWLGYVYRGDPHGDVGASLLRRLRQR